VLRAHAYVDDDRTVIRGVSGHDIAAGPADGPLEPLREHSDSPGTYSRTITGIAQTYRFDQSGHEYIHSGFRPTRQRQP
jgi:hypothetical protein